MPDEPAPTPAPDVGLDDLERRLASFESATKRLNRTIGSGSRSAPAVKPPTSRFGIPGVQVTDEVSGLRPAVVVSSPAGGPPTSALSPRNRGETVRTAFTSAHGRPNVVPARRPLQQVAEQAATESRRRERPRLRRWLAPVILTVTAALGLGVLALPRLFVTCTDGAVVVPTVAVNAPTYGALAPGAKAIGQNIAAGDLLGHVTTPPATGLDKPGSSTEVNAPASGVISSRLVAPGQQVQAGQVLFRIATTNSPSVAAPLTPAAVERVAIGDRVEVWLIGEARTVDGTISRILSSSADGQEFVADLRSDPRPQLLINLDPAPQPPALGQGARVTVIGSRPGPLRLALLRLRGMLPW